MRAEGGSELGYHGLEQRHQFTSFVLRRKARIIAWVAVASVVVYLSTWYFAPKSPEVPEVPVIANETVANTTIVQAPPPGLANHNATATFRENLLPSEKYVTTFVFAGFTNQVMEVVNLIYLGLLTNRIPVIPALLPSHIGSIEDLGPTNFGDIFDMPYLSEKLGIPLIEWHELKRAGYDTSEGPSPVTEKLGCWSLSAGNVAWGPAEERPTEWYAGTLYNLDISYTPVPSTFTLTHGMDPRTNTWSIWAIASLGYPKTRAQVLPGQMSRTFPLHDGSGEKLEPDEHMLCFDLLYYTGVVQPDPGADFFTDYSPFLGQVGIHMRWKQPLVNLARRYLRRHFGIENTLEPIPPFVAVHVRRADFGQVCPEGMSKDDCFAPIAAYHRRVEEVKERLRNRSNRVDAQAVLVYSDEKDPAWWDQAAAVGPEWKWIDHKAEQTVEKYGEWFVLFLDAVVQSMGAGFVGTRGSTMSEFSRVRVEGWNNGETATVHWGRPGADDH